MVLAPIRSKLYEWHRKAGPSPRWKDALGNLLKNGDESLISNVKLCIQRFEVIGCGRGKDSKIPEDIDEFRRWYRGD